MFKKICVTAGVLAAVFQAQGQQTMAEFSVCDGGEITVSGGTGLAGEEFLCDKNDLTVFEAENANGLEIEVKTLEKWVVKGLVVVAAENVEEAPAKMTLYGRNAGEDWTAIGKFARVKYSGGAYTSYIGKTYAAQTAGRQEFKLVIDEAGSEGKVRMAEMQLLGYPESDSRNVAVEANGEFSAPESTENLWAIGGGNYVSPVTIKNVKGADGIENAWVDFRFDEPTVIEGYALTANPSSASTMRPATWDLMASEDGENWVTLDMRNNEESFNADNYQQRYELPSRGAVIDYAGVADEIYTVMLRDFYRDYWGGKYLVHSWNPDESKINRGYNYWWMAHTVDAFTDAYNRTGKRVWQTRALQIKKGMYTAYDAGRQDLWNSYYDDMEWMAIACINAYRSYGVDEWLKEAKQLFEWIWGGWSETGGGGIAWNCDGGRDSKNSCSNAPAIIIAARLYEITGEEHYLEKAKMIYEFMLTHSRFDDGFIKDAPGNDNRGWTFSYNQGTWVGGLLELYRITGEETYREIATDLMDKCLDGRWYSPHGIMREQGGGDGGLFKGIFIRYITEWVVSGMLDEERQYRYAKYLVENAKSLYQAGLIKPEYKIMPSWRSREARFNNDDNGGTGGDYHSSIMLSGLFLLEGVDLMRREGILNDDYSVKNDRLGKPYRYYRMRFTDNQGGQNLQFGALSLYGAKGDASVAKVDLSGKGFAVSGGAGMIEISGGAAGTPVAVVRPDGMTVARGTTADGVTRIEAGSGIYIVKTGEQTDKVAVY